MKQFLLLFYIIITLKPAFSQSIVYVTPTGAGANTGSSWTNALPGIFLADRVATATAGTQFWIAAGTYTPTPTTDRTVSFSIASGVQLYGGFAGTESTLTMRHPLEHKTIISGNIGYADSLDNSYHILVLRNTSADTRIDNLIIAYGNSTDTRFIQESGDYEEKGAVYNSSSNATFSNCTFMNNITVSPLGRGGGMYNKQSSPTLLNCSFIDNFSYLGSGLFNDDHSNPMLVNCLFTKNKAIQGAMGSAVYSQNASQPTLINCTIAGNTDTYAGPIVSYNSPSPNMINCIVWGNGGNPFVSSATAGYQYSLTQFNALGTGNIGSDPLFVDPDNGDFRLKPGSPAINSGNPDKTGLSDTDITGQARIQGGRVDMGAYEFADCSHTPCPPISIQRRQ